MEHNAPMKIFGSWYASGTILTINQIPSHRHDRIHPVNNPEWQVGDSSGLGGVTSYTYIDYYSSNLQTSGSKTLLATSYTGGNQAHDHQVIPPSFTVYAWYRVS